MRNPMLNLCKWIEESGIRQPVRLEMKVDCIANQGKSFYIKVRLNNQDISIMVAEAIGRRWSKSGKFYGDVISHIVCNDVLFELQHTIASQAAKIGFPNMFDIKKYNKIEG